ncbi:uncharacterized protein SOCEGT47_062360 [Sorangium cellulosum]|uniref:HEAT repeat domain-containing protein n=1 Tax=Sorangium cellulosum TaxID=56 RepID=A0A4P2Q809_SORCE|nr:hypothetical protein [Sorangium cellulosum]AUX25687.1 uncharacterized protein SOCEGT47_062360 [Sorangium cellulosum]
MGPFRETWTKAEVEAVIARGDPAELLYVPLVVSLDPPGRVWAEQICLRLAGHPSPDVRGNALLGLGHLARIFRSLHRRRVQPAIEAGLQDRDPGVRGHASSAAEDVAWYLGWVLAGREHTRGRPVCPR